MNNFTLFSQNKFFVTNCTHADPHVRLNSNSM